MRNWKLMEQFNLSGKKATDVFAILKKVDNRRAELIKKRRKVLRQIRNETEKKSEDERQLKDLLKKYCDIMAGLATIPAQELAGLKEVFSVEEQARYLLFSQDFVKEIRGLIQQRQNDKPDDFKHNRPQTGLN